MTWRAVWQRLLIIPPVLLGVVIVVWMARRRPGSPQEPPQERAAPVRVITVPRTEVLPRAHGHGVVVPARTWDAVAEVSGRVLETHALLEEGALVPEGTVLVEIDPVDYEIALQQSQANLAELEAQLAELDRQEANQTASLEIEADSLELAEKDLRRHREMFTSKTVAAATVDEVERATLQQRTVVQNLRNSLALVPSQRQALEARRDAEQARRRAAERDLTRTSIAAPFVLRLREVTVQASQYIARGQVLARGDGLDVAEVHAQVQLHQLRHLVPKVEHAVVGPDLDETTIQELLQLSGVVRLRAAGFVVAWPATFDRMGPSLDPGARTVGVILAVERPYEQAQPGIRPPLMRDMFLEVELRGARQPDRVVVPRTAVHEDEVYLVDGEGRLQRQRVRIDYVQNDHAVLASEDGGLQGGETLIVSDPIPAMNGMLVAATHDEALEQELIHSARGAETDR